MEIISEASKNINLYNIIFLDDKEAILFLIRNNMVKTSGSCVKCDSRCRLIQSALALDGFVLSCSNKKCRKRISIRKGTKIEKVQIKAKNLLRIIWCWVYNIQNYAAINICEVSEPTYIKVKDLIEGLVGEDLDESQPKIGGEGVRVQFDETAICNGLIINNPSHLKDDEINGIQWIVGGVVEQNCRKFVLELVSDRKSETMLEIFKKYLLPGSIIVTDGYPSYPRAAKEFGAKHEIVNHSVGFKTLDGTHTNQIENLWSHLKYQYRLRSGVNKARIVRFLKEFSWKKRHIVNSNVSTLDAAFNDVVNKFS